jgi:catechol 2,3-dioxygenase-like lactoylglutathione lyase family enzyme
MEPPADPHCPDSRDCDVRLPGDAAGGRMLPMHRGAPSLDQINSLPSREAVDEACVDLTGAGGTGRQPPYDAFWGARHAIVEDPDGNAVGLMSPIDASSKFWPPVPPPRSSS